MFANVAFARNLKGETISIGDARLFNRQLVEHNSWGFLFAVKHPVDLCPVIELKARKHGIVKRVLGSFA